MRRLIPVILLLLAFVAWMIFKPKEKNSMVHISGITMGNIGYNIKFINNSGHENIDLKPSVDSILIAFNQSLSTYIPDSEISRFNENSLLKFESGFFYPVLETSLTIHKATDGAFDPTIMPLVNAWGFGPQNNAEPDSQQIEELKNIVGMKNLFFDSMSICKLEEGVALDFSAIAKGYAVDLLLDFVKGKGFQDIFVEIGGEVAAVGINQISGKSWTVGIEDPTANDFESRLFKAYQLKDQAVATSGNYRNFRIVNGKKISHTISPFTGYPVTHSLLSASVFAPSCMEADAYATAFMVLGMDKSIEIIERSESLEAFLIFSDTEGNIQSYQSDGIVAANVE